MIESLTNDHGPELGLALALPVTNLLLRTIEAKGQRFLSTSDVENLMRNSVLFAEDLISVFRRLNLTETKIAAPESYGHMITALVNQGVPFPTILKANLCPKCFHVFLPATYTGAGVKRILFNIYNKHMPYRMQVAWCSSL